MPAVAHDASASAAAASSTTLTIPLTVASNSNRYLIVCFAENSTGFDPVVSSVKWNTTETFTLVNDLNSAGHIHQYVYGLKNPTATTSNVVITWDSASTRSAGVATSLYNVNQTTPVGTVVTNNGTTSTNIEVSTDQGSNKGGMIIAAMTRETTASVAQTLTDADGIPNFVASGALTATAATTSQAPALPAGTLRGDLIIAHCASENNATHSCSTTGWNKLGQTNSGASWTVSHWWAIQTAAGLSAPSITWSGSNDASSRTHAYRDTQGSGTPALYIGTVGTGSGATHTSTGGNTTGDDSLAVYVDHCNANTAMGAPAGWTERTDSGSATGPCRTVVGDKDVATSGTGTGNISVTGGAAAWVQQQIEVLNALNGDQTNNGEQEGFDSNNASFSSSRETADNYNTFSWTWTGGTTNVWIAAAVPVNPLPAMPVFGRGPIPFRRLAA